jgi:nitrous oxide reductase accessory protein NosL
MDGRVLVLVAALALTGGCRAAADGPPAIELDRTTCSRCGMLVSETIFAAASRDQHGVVRVFDDIGCLRKAHDPATAKSTTFWFHDARDGSWIEGRQASFVAAPSLQTPMGGGLLAFRDRTTAEAEAAARHGRIAASVDELLGDGGTGGAR